MAKRIVHSAIFLALVSIILSTIMFGANSPWAAVVELSVCAGLITVLFASTASMVGRGGKYAQREGKKFLFLPLALVVFGAFIWAAAAYFAPVLDPVKHVDATPLLAAGEIIWKLRLPDIIGQLCIFVAGVLTVRIILGEGSDE
jgi:NADH-quinone oxidoreductase subunit J